MDLFYCQTRLFWAFSRLLFAMAVIYDVLFGHKNSSMQTTVLVANWILFIYAVSFILIATNEIREKNTNTFFLKIIGIISLVLPVLLAYLTLGSLKSGFAIILFLFFIWFVLIGLKDILGNHFFDED